MIKFSLEARGLVDNFIQEPGIISKCYSTFTNYSLLNGLALMHQCGKRGLRVGPCASFLKWKELGGHVKQGEKALFVNVPCKVKIQEAEEEEDKYFQYFYWKPCIFTLSQVEGVEKTPETPKVKWSSEKMLSELGIKKIPFTMVNGNTQGYSCNEGVAVNPLGQHQTKTLVHEVAHFLLHINKKCKVSPEIKEAEAELTAAMVGYALGLDGAEESRGYAQHWLGDNKLTNKSALRVLACANRILKAGNNR